MHYFVDIEVWPLNKDQGKKIISYSNSLKVSKQDDKLKKAIYCKKSFFTLFIPEFDLYLDLKMENVFSKSYENNVVCVHAKEKIKKFCLLQNYF